MRKRLIIAALAAAGVSAAVLIYGAVYSEKSAVTRAFEAGIRAVEQGDTETLRGLFWEEWESGESLLAEAGVFFNEFGPVSITVTEKVLKINGNEASLAAAAVIRAELEGLGEVEGSQAAGIRFMKTRERGYGGWRVSGILLD